MVYQDICNVFFLFIMARELLSCASLCTYIQILHKWTRIHNWCLLSNDTFKQTEPGIFYCKLRGQCSGCDMDFRMRVSAPFEATVVAVVKVASLWTTSIISTELGVMLAYLKICIFLQNTNKKTHNLILFSDICMISDIHLALAWRLMINCSHQHWFQFRWR